VTVGGLLDGGWSQKGQLIVVVQSLSHVQLFVIPWTAAHQASLSFTIYQREVRRQSFQSQMTAAVDGFGECPLEAFVWGDWHGDEEVGDFSQERPATLGAVKKLTRRRHLSVDELTYLRGRTNRIPKVTLPSPGLWANFWSPQHSRQSYPTLDHFLGDVTDILRDEVAELVRLGATYIQLDAPHYALLIDPKTRSFYESQGWGLDRWLTQGIEMDNAVMGDFPGVTFGFHL